MSAAESPVDARFSAPVVRAAYDAVAFDYAKAFGDDLDRLPLDRAMLDEVAARMDPSDLVLDLGCGPASLSHYLEAEAISVVGVDLSPRMLAVARSRNPTLELAGADMRHLPFRADTFAAVVAYYSIQHLPSVDLPAALDEITRVLRPNGMLLLATHLGRGDVVIQDFLGHRIEALGGALYERHTLMDLLHQARFEVAVERQRGPLANEVDTERIYLLAMSR